MQPFQGQPRLLHTGKKRKNKTLNEVVCNLLLRQFLEGHKPLLCPRTGSRGNSNFKYQRSYWVGYREDAESSTPALQWSLQFHSCLKMLSFYATRHWCCTGMLANFLFCFVLNSLIQCSPDWPRTRAGTRVIHKHSRTAFLLKTQPKKPIC